MCLHSFVCCTSIECQVPFVLQAIDTWRRPNWVMCVLMSAFAFVRALIPLSLLQAIDLQKVQKAKADALVLFELFLDEVSGRPYDD